MGGTASCSARRHSPLPPWRGVGGEGRIRRERGRDELRGCHQGWRFIRHRPSPPAPLRRGRGEIALHGWRDIAGYRSGEGKRPSCSATSFLPPVSRCLHLGSSGGRISRRIFLRISRPRGSLTAACRMPSPTAAHPHLLRLRSMVNEVLSHPVDCDSCRDSKGLS